AVTEEIAMVDCNAGRGTSNGTLGHCRRSPLRSILSWLPLLGFLCMLVAAEPVAFAEGYPDKPIRIIVPYPPGGFNDTLARTLGQKLHQAWSQPVVVENRPGGGTIIGTGMAAKAP